MDKQKENINSLMRRLLMVGLFMFITFAFKTTDCSAKDSFCSNTHIVHFHDFGKTTIQNNSAILASSVSFPNIAACELFTLKICSKISFKVIYSNIEANQLLKDCKKQFLEIKPHITDLSLFRIRTSLNTDEISSIS
jgi:hypothetical protein